MFSKKRLAIPLFVVGFSMLAVVVLIMSASLAAADPGAVTELIASGLDHPRGLAFGPNGNLYVSEAGLGGQSPCVVIGTGDTLCYGPTGAVTEIDMTNGTQQRIINDLPSLSIVPTNTESLGASDVAFDENGTMFVMIGLGRDPDVTQSGGVLDGIPFASIVEYTGGGNWTQLVDIGAYEIAANPDGGFIDSNPFTLLSSTSGHVVGDAGGNSLLGVDPSNVVSTIAVFPDRMVEFPPGSGNMIPMQAVPTSVVNNGPDSAYYVGQLTGFPFPVGGANVFRVQSPMTPTVYISGFTNILDIDFDAAGNLYVLEMAMNSLLSGDPTGRLVMIDPSGAQTVMATSGLFLPTGMTVGPDGAVYVSNSGLGAGVGEVLRITAAPTSVSLSGFGGQSSQNTLTVVLLAGGLLALGAGFILRRRSQETGV